MSIMVWKVLRRLPKPLLLVLTLFLLAAVARLIPAQTRKIVFACLDQPVFHSTQEFIGVLLYSCDNLGVMPGLERNLL
jgi:hypothetical protein